MFPCSKCKQKTEVAENLKSNGDSERRERECLSCHFRFKTTEVSDDVFKSAVRKRARELAREMVTDLREILGTGKKKQHG